VGLFRVFADSAENCGNLFHVTLAAVFFFFGDT